MGFDSENIIYLSVENVEDLHELAIERDNGLLGREPGKLEAKLALPMSGFGDYERYPTIQEKAAVYLYELASGHCFADGNKRTALLATYAFLELNGYEVTSDDEGETDLFVRMIADAHTRPELDVVVKWIHENTRIKVNQDEYEYEIE